MDKNEGGLPDSKLKKGNFVDFNAAVSSPSMDHIQLYELANVPKEPNIPFQNKRNGDNKIILDSYTLVDNDFNKSTNNLKEPAKPIILPSLRTEIKKKKKKRKKKKKKNHLKEPNEPNVLFMGKSKNTTQEQAKTDSLQNKLDDNKSIVKNFLNGIEQKFIKATNNSEQDTKYQQNNDKEMKNSSFIGSSINTIKIIIEPKGFPDDNGETVEIIFHVHLPKFSFGGEPAILGSIEELGNWQKSNVKLKPYNKGRSSYWYSEPINIPIKRFENVIKYKYAINTLLKSFQYEGTSSNDNRELKIKNQNFDIWRNNSTHGINKITDYMFLDIIFESVTLENIKEMIIEYNGILNKYSELTFSITNIQFISKQLLDNSIGIGKRLFLCFLLGHCDYRLELQRDFQTVPLLQAFFTVHSDTFPFDSWKIVFKGIDLLIHHNINNGLYEWLKIFTITRYARYVDFEFDSVSFANCNDDSYIENCFKIILELEFDESAHMKIIKWLLRQCKNMKMVLIVWQSSNKSDELLRQLFVENTKKIISKANLVDLYENLTMLSDDIRDKVAYQFRERVLNLLNGHRSAILDNSEFKSIFTLLISVHLGWTKVDYINVLETVSTFEDYQLLNVFPSFLKYWIKMPNDFDDIISQICIQWYKNLMNRMDSTAHKGEYVTVVFEKLSSICSLINEPRISDALMEITFNRIRPSSEQSIFNTVSIVLKFCSEAVQVLTKVIIEKIDSMELGCGELLLKKMLVICGCTGKILNIPNEFCEITLLYILSRLQQSSSKPYSKESLNDCAIFWIVILRATGSTNMFHSHKLVQETRTSIFRLACVIKNRSINIQQLQDLLNFNDYFLYAYLNSAHNNREIITMDTLAIVRHKCQIYEHRLKFLDDFYKRFCPIQKTKDVQNYLDELIERSKKLNEISIKESLSKTHWEFHNEIISIAESTSELNKSQVFYNVFDKHLNDVSKESSDDVSKVLDVKFIARKLMKDVLKEYVSRCKQYERWEDLEYSKEISFWYKVSNFDVELKLLEKHSNIQISKGDAFMMTLKYLSRYKDWKERTENLLKVTKIIRVKANWLDDLFNHERLGTLSNSIEIINQKFSKFNDNSWGFTKELTRSQEFIAFLKCKSDDDLKNLINGVDEHSDTRLIQEGTISSLIQVKQFMNPFMNDPSFTLDALIKKLSNINPSLASKLALCNSNVRALINMYKSTYNKGEVSKEKIQNAVKVGTYGFTKKEMDEDCILELSYPSKLEETIKLNINELQDLRSRALLSSKPCASIGQIDDDFAEIKARMEEFVIQVDIAQSIIITMKKLTQLGHFGYRKYNESVRGTNNLKKIAILLRNDLEIWKDTVNRAQGDCYYLTFYPARHILALYDYYTKSRECLEITETCQILVSFVNRKAKLPRQNDIGFNCNKSEYDLVLREINGRLEDIFGTLQKHARLLKISVKIKCGELFVATCDDKSKVPNIIMSFYANHGYYPEPWQLLICTTSTTEEELSIFIKRCYLASKNGYKGHLFCIANLEILDFELQYYLVNRIKSFTEKVDFYLALICCSVIGMHNHIVDQFSENIHTADGLDTIAMRSIYRKLCPKVTCVTSELSGQGKTQFIKQEISKNKKNMVTFLISDGASFNSLIRQLKKSHIQKDDSLHINIISADNPGEINLFLFQLLTLRIISNNADIISLPDSYIYIEVAGNCLIESLPFLDCLNNLHLIWNINRLMVTKDVQSPIQVVCRYLDLYDRNMLDKQDIVDFNVLLDQKYCQQLLDRYFFKKIDSSILSFRFLEIFVNLLADQLFRLSESPFFTVENLKFMTKDVNIRSTLFNILLDVSIDFATKSIKTKSAQLQSISDRAAEVDQLGNLVQWDDSNHLLVFFMSQSPESICALYRNKNIVPNNVTNLLKSQSFELADYQTMSSDQLLITLECLARKTMHKINYTQYALSTDNLLKMALMLLRTRANIPVVICGDAGCGKTSLISFLAKVVEVEFYALNLHAGIKEKDIKDFMNESHKKALISEIWLFFDEINTCNHIGLLAELIAHRKLDGKTIHHNIRLFAACNPYRIRNKSVSSVGLKSKKIGFEQQNKGLVYEVKPLPDQILDYVWDYGTIRPQDEMTYIQLMIHEAKLSSIFAELLFSSQEFIRNVEEPYSVSLRDVKRAIKLVNFFNGSLSIRQNENNVYPDNSFDILTRSYILALGLCYQSRLCDHELRIKYRNKMCEIFKNIDDSQFKKIIRDEQMDLMKRMICPPNIAFNEALLENVLAVIVCICCKIPLFIVGSPGSSKSLAIRLVYQNLRGHDSNDTYFRTLPLVFLIPHQGSSSSTSDGIEIVFQKANAYQKTCSKDFLVISVVLLDEIGLAEISPHNPLKVLHSLLEPSYPDDGPTVSVIGISNWRLDNSKNSRALLVQRPNFELNNLVETAVSLLDSSNEAALRPLAKAYFEYEAVGQKEFPNFHGLRDYYALIKSLSNKMLTPKEIYLAIARNFGGNEQLTKKCLDCFKHVITNLNDHKSWTYDPIPINTLINENLESKGSRHLMVIGKSDSIVNILTYLLHKKNLDPVVIFGSQFPEDRDDYSYSILSKIMMCVEAGQPLILTDLESIYGALYDLWNQNYITTGSSDNPKYYTRVALGAYANPMLHIHPDFRCILVLDNEKLNNADPPLLNRFEKQQMTIKDILNKDEKELVNKLREWTRQMTIIVGTEEKNLDFTTEEVFIGYNKEETLESLIIDIKIKDPGMKDGELLEKCKENLVATATSDGMIRVKKSTLHFEEIQHLKNIYFQTQHHDDLADYFQDLLQEQTVQDGHLVIINTFSNINTGIISCLDGITKCYILKLSTFKTESQFLNQVNRFWFELDHEFLILQCDISIMNADCIKLAKFNIERCRSKYLQKRRENNDMKIKHACIILHTHRENQREYNKNDANIISFNFMSGWNQITIESLTKQKIPTSDLLKYNLCDIIQTIYPFEDILKQELLWCLLCIKFPDNIDSINHVNYLSKRILDHPNFVNCLKIRTLEWLKSNTKTEWTYHVASTKLLFYPHSSFAVALQAYIRTVVRHPIAKVLYSLERLGVTKTFMIHDLQASPKNKTSEQLLKFWKDMFMNNNVINFDSLPEPKPDIYIMPINVFDLQFPFSIYVMKRIDSFRPLYDEEMTIMIRDTKNLSRETYNQEFSKKILRTIILLNNSPLLDASDLYFNDFVNVVCSNEQKAKNTFVLSRLIQCKLCKEMIKNPINLHIFWWNNASSTLAAFRLISECPSIFNEELFNAKNLEQRIVNEVTKLMLNSLSICQEIVELQLQFRNILNFCENLTSFKRTKSFQMLTFCHELLSTESIPLEIIKEIIEIRDEEDMFTKMHINRIFEILSKIEPDNTLIAKQSFIIKCCEIFPYDSPLKLELYHTLFLEDPFHLRGQTIKSILEKENKNNSFESFMWLDHPRKMMNLPLFKIMNTCLEKNGCQSTIAALFCDIIQKAYFTRYNLIELSTYYHCAIEALCADNVAGLHLITAIAFLKEFVHEFWKFLIQDNILKPVELDFNGVDERIIELINKINCDLNSDFRLVDSLKFYFLRDLRNRGSMSDVHKFCQAQKHIFPWLENLPWDNNQETRLQFDVYNSIEDYSIVERNFARFFYYRNSLELFNEIFNKISRKEETSARISLMGGIFNQLHIIRATREWNLNEESAATHLKKRIKKASYFSKVYKIIIQNVITNKMSILQIDTNASNSDILIKSVIGHVVALHSSIPAEVSPLAYMQHNLDYCSDLYILTCLSDVESVLLNANLQQEKKYTRYRCKCGYPYLIGDCGGVNEQSKCPECKNTIGNGQPEAGNVRLDSKPIKTDRKVKDEKGYIREEINRDIHHNVRNLSPTSYRILHLFVHSIIGAWAPSDIVTKFSQNISNGSVEYCMEHIRNDWSILLNRLNCSEEDLALLLHAILDRMFLIPPNHHTTLKEPQEREEWETNFSQDYVVPLIKNIRNTITEFRVKLANTSKIEEELNQTTPMDEKYIGERLPRLWRFIGIASFQDFYAFYNSDIEKNESSFPFISIFFKYFNKLEKVKYLWPIVNFVQILSSHLGHRVSRERAQEQTFQQFIDDYSNDEKIGEKLTSNFKDFAKAWNSVIDDVDFYRCLELQKPKPIINFTSKIALALVETKDYGVYLCAILEYLIGIHNEFLQEVLIIPIGSTKALKFLEVPHHVEGNSISSSNNANYTYPTRYYIQTLSIDQAKQNHFINYSWDDDILQNSDRNLEVGRGHDIIYDLKGIEMELARRFVYEKVRISILNDSELYMEPFSFHMELFQGYMSILGDIKSLIHQQKIPSDKVSLIMGVVSSFVAFQIYLIGEDLHYLTSHCQVLGYI